MSDEICLSYKTSLLAFLFVDILKKASKTIFLKGSEMKTRKYSILALATVVCTVWLCVTVRGISLEEKQQLRRFGVSTLKGLTGVCPKVHLFPREGIRLLVVTENTLQTTMELELRKAGIKILSDANDPDAGLFTLTITIDKVEDFPLFSVGAGVSLSQHVGLLRNPKLRSHGSTWPLIPTPITYCVRLNVLEGLLKDIVADQSKKFCNDYLAANQRKQVKERKARAGTIDSIPDDKMTWVKCNNPQCKAEYEMSLKAYYKSVQKRFDPRTVMTPALICEKCGKPSLYKACKCGNPDCAVVFFCGSVPNDFFDRCPECGRSETEEIRKKRKRESTPR